MAWLAYFSACAAAALTGRGDASFLRRLPLVGALVLAGNVLRNSVLVALEARPQGLAAGVHEAIGLALLAAVCIAVLLVMRAKPEGGRHVG
jgi:exosortase/archaeosortase family protein